MTNFWCVLDWGQEVQLEVAATAQMLQANHSCLCSTWWGWSDCPGNDAGQSHLMCQPKRILPWLSSFHGMSLVRQYQGILQNVTIQLLPFFFATNWFCGSNKDRLLFLLFNLGLCSEHFLLYRAFLEQTRNTCQVLSLGWGFGCSGASSPWVWESPLFSALAVASPQPSWLHVSSPLFHASRPFHLLWGKRNLQRNTWEWSDFLEIMYHYEIAKWGFDSAVLDWTH